MVHADRPIPLIAPEDVGKAAAAATQDPQRFHGVTLHPGVAHAMAYLNVAPVLAKSEIARGYRLTPITFETWARQQRGLAYGPVRD